MKTALVFGGVVAAVALVVTLALPMLGPVLDRYAESWVIGAVFNAVQFESPNRETISSVAPFTQSLHRMRCGPFGRTYDLVE